MKETVSFVEDKKYDFKRIQSLLYSSISQNHHSNFGPVSALLESTLSKINGIDLNGNLRETCCGSSATALINAVISSLDNIHERPLTWVSSDFGFFTNYMGGLTNSIKVPCNNQGMLCLDSLSTLDLNVYDAIVVTNVFGLFSDFSDYINFAVEHNKVLLIDNAAGFGALSSVYREESKLEVSLSNIVEVISLHHTKPWGVGEGGAVFAAPDLIEYVRASINFGVNGQLFLEDSLWCSNGKMSEISAAAILARAETSAIWSEGYIKQSRRISKILRSIGMVPLVNELPKEHIFGQVAYLLESPVSREKLRGLTGLPLEKYYRPTNGFGKNAIDIHSRIMNIPCHPGMELFSDNELNSRFSKLVKYISK